jgi:hypothetical protein
MDAPAWYSGDVAILWKRCRAGLELFRIRGEGLAWPCFAALAGSDDRRLAGLDREALIKSGGRVGSFCRNSAARPVQRPSFSRRADILDLGLPGRKRPGAKRRIRS